MNCSGQENKGQVSSGVVQLLRVFCVLITLIKIVLKKGSNLARNLELKREES